MNDSDLDRLLRTWTAPEVPADAFRRGVWQRIEHLESAAPPLWQRWLDALLRPRIAVAGFSAFVLAGTAAGMLHASVRIKSATFAASDAAAAYVQSINPLDPVHLTHAESGK
jgi:hypothetical protein